MQKTWDLGISCIYNDYSDTWKNGEKPDGFTYVELSAGGHPHETEAVKEETVARYREEYKMATEQGLKLWSVHMPYGPKLDLNVEAERSDEVFFGFDRIGFVSRANIEGKNKLAILDFSNSVCAGELSENALACNVEVFAVAVANRGFKISEDFFIALADVKREELFCR